MIENLSANAGDTGLSPGLGRSHMPQSSWAREPQLLSLRVWSLCSTTREATIVRGLRTAMKSGPHLPQLEKALTQKRRPNTAIKINNFKKKQKFILLYSGSQKYKIKVSGSATLTLEALGDNPSLPLPASGSFTCSLACGYITSIFAFIFNCFLLSTVFYSFVCLKSPCFFIL